MKDLAPQNPVIRSAFEDGSVQTRPRFTRIRKSWALDWRLIKEADYQAIYAHFVAQKGGSDSFTWTNYVNGMGYTVRYKEFGEAETIGIGWRYNFSLTLEEV